MLVVRELVRDVLCNELIELDKDIKSLPCDISSDMMQHIVNMKDILTGKDFVYMDIAEMQRILDSIVRTSEYQEVTDVA